MLQYIQLHIKGIIMNKFSLSTMVFLSFSTTILSAEEIKPIQFSLEATSVESFSGTYNTYLGVGLTVSNTGVHDLSYSDFIHGQDRNIDMSLLLGFNWNDYLDLEGRYVKSVAIETLLERTNWGVYLKPKFSLLHDLEVYGLIGFGGLIADGIHGHDIKINALGFQWGAGVSYEVIEDYFVFADYTSIGKSIKERFSTYGDTVNSSAMTVGMMFKF